MSEQTDTSAMTMHSPGSGRNACAFDVCRQVIYTRASRSVARVVLAGQLNVCLAGQSHMCQLVNYTRELAGQLYRQVSYTGASSSITRELAGHL